MENKSFYVGRMAGRFVAGLTLASLLIGCSEKKDLGMFGPENPVAIEDIVVTPDSVPLGETAGIGVLASGPAAWMELYHRGELLDETAYGDSLYFVPDTAQFPDIVGWQTLAVKVFSSNPLNSDSATVDLKVLSTPEIFGVFAWPRGDLLEMPLNVSASVFVKDLDNNVKELTLRREDTVSMTIPVEGSAIQFPTKEYLFFFSYIMNDLSEKYTVQASDSSGLHSRAVGISPVF